jgi:SAM-dependent methyltransferase
MAHEDDGVTRPSHTAAPGAGAPRPRRDTTGHEQDAWQQRVRDVWEAAGRAWEKWEPLLMGSMSAVDPVLIRALRLAPGQRVLDFGCGIGDPALTIAPLVAPRGSVLAVDMSRPMVEAARRRARARGIGNVRFRVADVTRFDPEERFDRVVARYGIMFPPDVEALLIQLRGRLRAGGRGAFAVWGPRKRNAYFGIVAEAAPPPESQPHALRFADVRRLTRLVRRAGFHDVRAEGVLTPFTVQSGEQYAALVMDVSGSTREIMARLSAATRRRFRDDLVRRAETYRAGDVVRLPGFAWVVSAAREGSVR